ncbi:MAG: DUF4097 family beta strand repeat-containing protein [Thermoanaerobaculia bacterium]
MRTKTILSIAILLGGASIALAGEPLDCSRNTMNFGNDETARGEETLTIPAGKLKIDEGHNGGVTVRGGDVSAYRVTICKTAAGDDRADAEARVARIHGRVKGGELSVEGPAGGVWGAFILVEAPQGSDLEIEARNGPVSVAELSGTIRARAKNGPMSFKNVAGTLDAESNNGPLSLKGGSGNAKLRSANGPLSIVLAELNWNGEIDASTSNGPLSLKLPVGFRSGVTLEADEHTPMRCAEEICGSAVKTESGDRKQIRFGTGDVIRLSAENGPVSVAKTND